MQGNTGSGQNNQGSQGSNNQKPGLSWSQPSVPATTQPKVTPAVTSTPKTTVVTTAEKSYTGTYVGIFVAGIIIGALIGWAITSSHNGGGSSTTATSTTMDMGTSSMATSSMQMGTMPSTGSNGSFTVSSPQTAGFAVNVTNVKISQPTWVVVYEDRNGTLGNALGAALFLPQAGSAQTGTIQLLRATLPGQNYFAGEAIDDGDKVFSLQNDKSVRDAQGNPILVQFSAE